MDFMNRAQQPRPVAPANANNVGAVAQNRKHDHDGSGDGGKWYRTGTVVLLGLIVILVIAMTGFFAWGNMGEQSKYLNKNEYQAVFVNVNGTSGGQVYFGHIQAVNSQYIDLTNVFYIQNQSSGSSQSSQTSSSYTLVKLGCELHGPEDQMVINTSQVYFWENLKPSGQVSQKIAQYYKQNPNGQTCTQTNSTTQSNATTQSSTNTNASNSSSATTTPASSTSSSTKKQ